MKTISINVSKSPMKILAFLLSLALLVTSISGAGIVFATDSSLQSDGAKSTKSLSSVINPDTNEEMFVVNSTFYDYYSDSQVNGASGTTPGKIDDGVYGTDYKSTENSFTKFNTMLYNECGYNSYTTNYKLPLYCGLFYNSQPAASNGNFYFNDSDSNNVAKNFWLAANSSQRGGGKEGTVATVNAVTQGLVDDKLSDSGIVTQAGKNVPFFDKEFLTTTKHEGKTIPLGEVKENVSFPFRTVVNENGVSSYQFDSRYDTVRFNSNNQLDYLGYNKTYNKDVQVLDQKKDNDNATVGYQPGFFPYNSSSESSSTSLYYGYGVKIDIPFNMTKDGKINGEDIIFEFSGDDDVWVFIDGHLVLDLGGAHGRAEGKIDFAAQTAWVSAAKDNKEAFSVRNYWNVTDEYINKNITTNFSEELVESLKKTSTSHTLTMFYMERGKIESNMKINFNLPQPNSLTVTNKITMDRVNDSLKPATKEQTDIELFSYVLNDQTDEKDSSFTLKDKENTTYTDAFKTGNVLDLTETQLTDENRVLKELYETKWDLNDEKVQISTSEGKDNYAVSDDRSQKDNSFLFLNKSDAPTTNLTANYVNDVLVADLTFTKDVASGVEYDGEEFNFKVKFSNVFGGPSKTATYEGKYLVREGEKVEEKTTQDGIITLKAHQAAVIQGVPVLTKYEVEEVQKNGSLYFLDKVTKYGEENYSGKTATGTISKEENSNQFTFVNGKSEIPVTEAPATPEPVTPPAVTKEPTPEPTKAPTPEPTVEPTAIPTLEPTKAPTSEPTAVPTPTPKPLAPLDQATEVPATEVPATPEPTEVPDYNNPSAEDEEEVEEEEPTEIEEEEEPEEEEDIEEEEDEDVEDVEVDADTPVDSPKTGDSTNLIFWMLSVVISAGAVILTGKDLFWKKRER